MSFYFRPDLREILSIFALTAVLVHPGSLAADQAGDAATRLEPGSVLRLATLDSERPPAIRLDLPGPGILTLDAIATGLDGAGAEVVLLPESGRWNTSSVTVLERSAPHLTAAVHGAGQLVFRVAPRDPRSTAISLKILTGFTPATVIEDAFLGQAGMYAVRSRFFAEVPKKVEPETVDPDPGNGVGASSQLPASVISWHSDSPPFKVEPETVDPDPGNGVGASSQLLASVISWHSDSPPFKVEPETVDPDPGNGVGASSQLLASVISWHSDSPPFKVEPETVDSDPGTRAGEIEPRRQVLFYERACTLEASSDEADDHADIVACSTALHPARPLAGEIFNPWHDDHDVFWFILDQSTTVDLTTRGDTDTLGELADHAGQVLATDDDSGDDRNFRLTRTLAPGHYFVRVRGAGTAEGRYQLSMTHRNR